jgi:serine/threonine protein kinase/Tfp pilus assembly protein PilF
LEFRYRGTQPVISFSFLVCFPGDCHFSSGISMPAEEPLKPEPQERNLDTTTELLHAGVTAGGLIDRYRTVRKIGEGGMGEVWLAEQTEPVRRRVALKLIKAGMNSREIVARFESERQAIALMEHPAIAKVLDAGSTPDGAPYFVMEYVAGVPIHVYCDNHRLSIGERLDLFIDVCEGVQHAHQKAIIHRDLKPSNILVAEIDGRPGPKIIDFGVAKALAQRLSAATMFTQIGALLGTPQYMSPEQALSSGEDIDTRTDVYALGAILYELLAGALPLEPGKMRLDEFLHRLQTDDPVKPSTRIRAEGGARSTEVAGRRRSEPVALTRELRGDLDSIVLKALEKDRSLRYGSPSDLAADIRRYLRHDPVLAVPPSTGYRARKFARRYRTALATSSAFALVLLAASAFSIRESVRANREAAVAQAVSDFLQNDLLAQASSSRQGGPSAKPDPELKVRTVLDRAAARLVGKFDGQPEVEASIRDTVGRTYLELGLFPEARQQLERALELHRRALGSSHPKSVRAVSRLGRAVWLQGNYGEAEALLSRALEMQRKALGAEHPDTLDSAHNLGIVSFLQGKYAQAEAQYRNAAEMRGRVLGQDHPDTLRSRINLAMTLAAQGKHAEAESFQRENLEMARRLFGPEHPDTLKIMNNLANVYQGRGNYARAEALSAETLEIRRRVLGPEHPETLGSMNNLAVKYDAQGKYEQAGALFKQTLDIQRRVVGPEFPDTLKSMGNLAAIYLAQGRYAEAEALLVETIGIDRRVFGPEHPESLLSMNKLADVYSKEGRQAEAEALFLRTLDTQRRVLGPEHPDTLSTLSDLIFMYQHSGRYAPAETYALQALAGKRRALGSEDARTVAAAADFALACLSQSKFTEAEPIAREALESVRRTQPDHWLRFRSASLLGASLAGQKKYGEGEPLLVEGYNGMAARKDRIAVADRYHIDRAREWLAQFYRAWGKPERAAVYRAHPGAPPLETRVAQ